MLRYSDSARVGYGFLYRHYNDIDVFVEDTSCVAMWENLLNVVIAGRCRLTRVLQLGGKVNVIAACRRDQGHSPRRRIYIIDGDFDIWRGRRRPNLKHLYRINAYCVENLLIGQAALIEVLRDAQPSRSIDEIERSLSYADFTADCYKLVTLFALYASVFTLGISVPTISYSVHRLTEAASKHVRISESLLQTRLRELQGQILELASDADLAAAKESIESRVTSSKLVPDRHISGKDYLFPLLYARSRVLLAYRESADTLKARLARHYDIRADPGLKRAIERLLA